jgi:hypothetical protein
MAAAFWIIVTLTFTFSVLAFIGGALVWVLTRTSTDHVDHGPTVDAGYRAW